MSLSLALDLSLKSYLMGSAASPPSGGITVQYGRTSGYDAGTTGDYFVDQVNGDDGNAGTSSGSAFATYAAARTAANTAGGGKTIRLMGDGVVYPAGASGFVLDNGNSLRAYGTDRPVIGGGVTVTGFAACDGTDDAILGAGHSGIYKASVAKASLSSTLYNNLLPLEGGATILNLVQRRRDETNLYEQTRTSTFFNDTLGDDVTFGLFDDSDADATANDIEYIEHPTVLDGYSEAQLAQCLVMPWCYPNIVVVFKVTASTVSTHRRLTLVPRSGITEEPEGSSETVPTKYAYNLLNLLPYLNDDTTAGRWGWYDGGGANLVLYVRPHNAATLLADGVELGGVETLLTVTGDGATVDGLVFHHAAADLSTDGMPVYFNDATNFTFKENRIQYTATAEPGNGALYARYGSGYTIENFEIAYAQNNYGLFGSGRADLTTTGLRVRGGLISYVSQSPLRFYRQNMGAVLFSKCVQCANGAHANKINWYINSDGILEMGLVFDNVGGYATVQHSSRILILNSIIPAAPNVTDDARAFIDQTGTDQPPTNPSSNYIIGCHMPKPGSNSNGGACITATQTNFDLNWGLYNSVVDGVNIGAANLIGRGNNIITTFGLGKTSSQAAYYEADNGTEDVVSDMDSIYYDHGNDDWETVPGSLLTTKAGADVSAIIAVWEALFSDLDLRLDIDGNVWDPASSGVGPWVSWPVKVDITAPVLSDISSSTAGSTATVELTTDERGGTLFWVTVADGAATPSAAQIIAGLNASGAAALNSGSASVAAPGVQPGLTVGGVTGETHKCCVVHRDRHSNVSAAITTDIAFPAYSPAWVAFGPSHYLSRPSAFANAQVSTQSALVAFTVRRDAGHLAVSDTGGIFDTLPSTARNLQIDATTNGRCRPKLFERNTSTPAIADHLSGAAVAAGTELLYLLDASDNGVTGRSRGRVINVTTGAIVATLADDTWTTGKLLSWAQATSSKIGELLASEGLEMERLQVWDAATADVSLTATQDLFTTMGVGGLKDPAVAVAALGAEPLINLFSARLSTGNNAGVGGDYTPVP